MHPFSGIHILGEFYGVSPYLLDDETQLVNIMETGILKSKAHLCSMQSKKFTPQGVSVLALLSESHASIHTFPDKEAIFFDIFTCGNHTQPQAMLEFFLEAFKPKHKHIQSARRGDPNL
jgi:S-adenosylmethionine decarboxylase proenzyme